MKQVIFLGAFATIAVLGIYFVITFYDNNMKVGRMLNTVVVRPHEEPLLLMESGTVPFKGGEALLKAKLMNQTLSSAKPSSDAMVDFGKKEYKAFCSHCHGENFDGMGTVGQSFNPLPTDLINEQVAAKSDGELFRLISYGGDRAPALATTMSEKSRWAVISYLRSKQAENKQ